MCVQVAFLKVTWGEKVHEDSAFFHHSFNIGILEVILKLLHSSYII